MRGGQMLRNNVEMDLMARFDEDQVTQTRVAERVGVSVPYVNRIIHGKEPIMNKTFVKILEAKLLYLIQTHYRVARQKVA